MIAADIAMLLSPFAELGTPGMPAQVDRFTQSSLGIGNELHRAYRAGLEDGSRQIQRYIDELNTMRQFQGIEWKGVIEVY